MTTDTITFGGAPSAPAAPAPQSFGVGQQQPTFQAPPTQTMQQQQLGGGLGGVYASLGLGGAGSTIYGGGLQVANSESAGIFAAVLRDQINADEQIRNQFKVLLLPNASVGIYYSGVAITHVVDTFLFVAIWLVEASAEPPASQTIGGNMGHDIPAFYPTPDQVFNQTLVQNIVKYVQANCADATGRTIKIAGAQVLPHTTQITATNPLAGETPTVVAAKNVLHAVRADMGTTVHNTMRMIEIVQPAKPDDTPMTVIGLQLNPGAPVEVTPLGQYISGDATLTFATKQPRPQFYGGNQPLDLNATPTSTLAQVTVQADVMYSAQRNQYAQGTACFAPVIIANNVNSIFGYAGLTLAIQTLMLLAQSDHLVLPIVAANRIDNNRHIKWLNLLACVNQPGAAPMTGTVVHEGWSDDVIQTFLQRTLIPNSTRVALRVSAATSMAQRTLYDAARHGKQEDLKAAISLAFGDQTPWGPEPAFDYHYPCLFGYYTDASGQKRPLSDFTTIAILTRFGGTDPSAVAKWMAAILPGPLTWEQRLALMTGVINAATQGTARYTSSGAIIHLSPSFLTRTHMMAAKCFRMTQEVTNLGSGVACMQYGMNVQAVQYGQFMGMNQAGGNYGVSIF